MSYVAGMKDERRFYRHRIDAIYSDLQKFECLRASRFIEAYMPVANLDKIESPGSGFCSCCHSRSVGGKSLWHPAHQSPDDSRTGPGCHTFQCRPAIHYQRIGSFILKILYIHYAAPWFVAKDQPD